MKSLVNRRGSPSSQPSLETVTARKTTNRTAPTPILDNLDYLGKTLRSSALIERCNNESYLAHGVNDFEYATQFLCTCSDNTATFSAYRREIERLLQWTWHIRRTSVVHLKREDIEDFIRFCQSPPAAWIGTKNVRRFLECDGIRQPNPAWRPFVAVVSKTLFRNGCRPNKKQFIPSQATIRATFTALTSFYDFLVQEALMNFNPVVLIRQKSPFIDHNPHRDIVRRITNVQWDYVIETAGLLAGIAPAMHERTLFIMKCLVAMYLRISELVHDDQGMPVMGDFRQDADDEWWFHVTGRGNKNRTVAVSDDMLDALRRYRQYIGLSPLPSLNEQTPLVPKNVGIGPVTSTRQIRKLMQLCFDAAFDRMQADNLGEEAAELRRATVLWLRHTGISEDIKSRPCEHVKDDAGYCSMQATDRHIKSDIHERYCSGRVKRISDL